MIFSLIVPTRRRTEGITRLLQSVSDNTYDKKTVEVLFACDTDDKPTFNHLNDIKSTKFKDLKIEAFMRPRSPFLNNDYYNWLCQYATGEFYCIMGDDVIIKNKNWDLLAKNKIDELTKDVIDGVFYGNISDGTVPPGGSEKSFCCFPIISKKAFDAVGFLLPKEIATWGADVVLYELYQKINRVYDLRKEVVYDHISHHNYSNIQRDNVSFDIEKNYKSLGAGKTVMRWRSSVLPHSQYKLRKYIESFKKEKTC